MRLFCLAMLIAIGVATSNVRADTATGKDGNIELKLPTGWKTMDTPAGTPDVVQLMAVSAKEDTGVMVIVEDAADSTQTLADYAKAVADTYKDRFTDVSCTDAKPVKVNGNDALRFDVKCTINGIKLGYLVTALKLQNHFEQVDGWTVQSEFEHQRSLMNTLAGGMKPTFDKTRPAISVVDNGKPVTLKGKDGNVQITLPGGWAVTDSVDDFVQVTALNAKLDLGVMVTVESRENLTWDLKTYTEKVEAMLADSAGFTNVSKTSLKPVKVNGSDAMQFEFHGTRDKTQLAYLVTVMASEKNFLRVTAWSTESKFKAMKPVLGPLADGLKETAPPSTSPVIKK